MQADFYDPDIDLEKNASEEEAKAAFLRNTNHHTLLGLLVPIDEQKIKRPHVHIKSHSFNLYDRGLHKNNKVFKELVRTKDAEVLIDDLIFYEEASTQTEISFCGRALEKYLTTQQELVSSYQKSKFSEELLGILDQREETSFMRDKA